MMMKTGDGHYDRNEEMTLMTIDIIDINVMTGSRINDGNEESRVTILYWWPLTEPLIVVIDDWRA